MARVRAAVAATPAGPSASRPAAPPFSAWLPAVSPEFRWDWPHLEFIRDHLADVTLGGCRRLILNLPPQHGKTQQVTVRYPVWRLTREPWLRVAVTAYGQRLANRFSRAARRLARYAGTTFGEVDQVDEWEVGGGGSFIARGVGAGITGNPVDLLIVDDPYKDAKQALSQTYRDGVWDWWTDALETRLSKDAAAIVIHTRWSTDDLTARLEKQGGWRVVRIPAIAEPGDPLGRDAGAPLCPDLHPLEKLEAYRRNNPFSFAGLYQQQPIDREGGFFRGLESIRILPPPAEIKRVVRFWDLAATEDRVGADPDWTVGAKMGVDTQNRFWLLHVVRGRWSPKGVRDQIRQTALVDGKGVKVRVEMEGGASGKIVADLVVREELAGFPARAVSPEGDKRQRAEPLANQVEAGNVCFAHGAWNQDVLDEWRTFPMGAHDDIVDACSGALAALTGGGERDWAWGALG